MKLTRTILIAAAGAVSLVAAGFAVPALTSGPAAAREEVEVWKSASCGCCEGWVDHLRTAGFAVKAHNVEDLEAVKVANGVPAPLAACHTARVGGYVIEGHVPAGDILRLLTEKPVAKGLSVPGMPADSPGMDMNTGQPYEVVLFGTPTGDALYARH